MLIKKPLKIINKFYYRYLSRHDMNDAKKYLFRNENINSVLKTNKEVEDSLTRLKRLKLPPHPDQPKNWDALRALSFILNKADKDSNVLDVGSAEYGIILPWLELYGFNNLYGCDIAFEKDFQRGKIKYSRQDLQKTSFPADYFDFVTSISVIEHGVNPGSYFKEMSRIIKKGGYLLTSTDYWPQKIDTKGLYPYGKDLGEMKIFDKDGIAGLLKTAEKSGFGLVSPMDFTSKDKVVDWKRVNKQYSFIFFALEKVS